MLNLRGWMPSGRTKPISNPTAQHWSQEREKVLFKDEFLQPYISQSCPPKLWMHSSKSRPTLVWFTPNVQRRMETDQGQKWKNQPHNVKKKNPVNKDLLRGADGVWTLELNPGKSLMRSTGGLPKLETHNGVFHVRFCSHVRVHAPVCLYIHRHTEVIL